MVKSKHRSNPGCNCRGLSGKSIRYLPVLDDIYCPAHRTSVTQYSNEPDDSGRAWCKPPVISTLIVQQGRVAKYGASLKRFFAIVFIHTRFKIS